MPLCEVAKARAFSGRYHGLMISALDSGSSGPGLKPCYDKSSMLRGYHLMCVFFAGWRMRRSPTANSNRV